MAMTVSAGAIVVPVKGADRYLYRGAVVPEGVKADDIKRLKSIGLITEVKAATRPVADAPKQDAANPGESAGDAAGESAEESASDPSAAETGKAQSRSKK